MNSSKLKDILTKIGDQIAFVSVVHSPLNGKIYITKSFNHYDISAGGCYQSGGYVTNLWSKMINNVDKKFVVKHILLLGLGSGDSIRKIHKKFPNAQITAVEHDPIMIDLAKKYVFSKNKYTPIIINKDAKIALQELIAQNKTFDLALIDIFNGTSPSPLLYSDEFLKQISQILNHTSYLLVNFYRNKKTLIEIFKKNFSLINELTYRFNEMAIFRPFGNGNVGDPIPNDLKIKEQSKIYQSFALTNLIKSTPIEQKHTWGQRFNWKIITVDIFHTDIEPEIEPIHGLRLIIWHPITKTEKIKGWHRNLFIDRQSQNGFVKVKANYWTDWTNHANRHRKDWLKSNQYEISNVSIEEFETAYHSSKKLSAFLRKAFLKAVRMHIKHHGKDIDMVLIKDKKTNINVAGLITTNYPDISQSIHTIAFMRKEVKNTPVGYGVIINWYETALKTGIQWLNFGLLWKKGDPKEWQGYSKFKRQFNPYLIIFPRPYVRFTLQLKKNNNEKN